ncbi:MAG TPA: SDR family oxidoreductase [Bryobacteraceae bacterium]|nr:SDR family oxidoreductase [Bryobacteraceae bacterium]
MNPAKIAVITGGGSGIGRAVALAMHAGGYRVVLAGRRAEPLQETLRLAGAQPETMLAVPADVADPQSVETLFAETAKTFGRVDVLFNNAGITGPIVPLDQMPWDRWTAVVATNLTGAFLCAQHAIRMMKAQQPMGGRIINNGSLSAHVPRPNSAAYTATKHAISGLTKSISLEGRSWNIAGGQIDIGNAASEMTEKMTAGVLQANGTVMPEPRIDARHVAEAVMYMAALPLDVNVQFMTVMATRMPYIGRG